MTSIFRIVIALVIVFSSIIQAYSLGSRSSIISSSDPYYLAPGNGEPTNPPINSTGSVCDATGRVLDNTLSSPSTTLVLVTLGQSLIASTAAGSFTPVNSKTNNYSICDGSWYRCTNPVLGASFAPVAGPDSPNCRIADALITAGTYTQVIVVPIAIGGTVVADWNVGGQLYQKIIVIMNRLKQSKLTYGTGFSGDFIIYQHMGESDNQNNTSESAMAIGVRGMAATFVANGSGNAAYIVGIESMLAGNTNANITNGEADAVSSGCSTCRTGANWDTGIPNSGGNRASDGTHLLTTGIGLATSLDVSIIQACHALGHAC